MAFPVAVTRKIADEVERQRKSVAARVAWVVPANLHVTLRFLGSIDENLIDGALVPRLKKVAARNAPFEARARGFGSFPNVLWVGVESDGMVKLQREVEAVAVELGFAKEERVFHPHITVGRVKEGTVGEWSSPTEFGAATLNEIVVYESRVDRIRGKSGAEYIARARVALGKGD
jgi:2'-5' RNA ligase